MNIVATAQGALDLMLAALGSTPSMALRLFSNNVSVDLSTVLGGLTEASFTGYAALTPTWSTPVLVGTTATTVTSPTTQSFVYSGVSTTTVYGAYLTDSGNTILWGATTFAAAFTFTTTITTLILTPTYTMKSEFSTS